MFSERLLVPHVVAVKGKAHFVDVFCGSYCTFALTKEGLVYGFGLTNYHQLGQLVHQLLVTTLKVFGSYI